VKPVRCAIYTRKSSEEGLEQEFNSLHAQREACAAFIQSQKAEGWRALPDGYDDGGLSGGTLERPALHRLLADIDAGRVDQIVVYKIDRLTRSLADFAKIVDRLDAADTSFVSVTQSFNTATSMGRLTLNMLLSFAQFEREVTAERIRDKIAASKRKGLWMGGQVPFGYAAAGRTLRIRKDEAAVVRTLYSLYQTHQTVREVREHAVTLRLNTRLRQMPDGRTKGGQVFERGHIHHLLTNPLYAGKIRHKKAVYDGQHPAIVEPPEWDALQNLLQAEAAKPRGKTCAVTSSPFKGKLFDATGDRTGDRLTPTHTQTKGGKRLRYYVSLRLIKNSGVRNTDGWRLPAAPFEKVVGQAIKTHLMSSPFRDTVIKGQDAAKIAEVEHLLQRFVAVPDPAAMLDLVEEIRLQSNSMVISLSAQRLAGLIDLPLDGVPSTFEAALNQRKRGVESKFTIGGTCTEIDTALLANIAKAQDWFTRIKAGETYAQIAKADGTTPRRVQLMLDLAFLAPDIVRDVCEGKQPLGFTSEWLKTHHLPSDWADQRQMIATL
jgi:site-specific DNA recombinase